MSGRNAFVRPDRNNSGVSGKREGRLKAEAEPGGCRGKEEKGRLPISNTQHPMSK